jgi:hypothetical protein
VVAIDYGSQIFEIRSSSHHIKEPAVIWVCGETTRLQIKDGRHENRRSSFPHHPPFIVITAQDTGDG